MPAVRIQFVFLQQTAAGRRKIAEAEQEQRTGASFLYKRCASLGRSLSQCAKFGSNQCDILDNVKL